MNCDQVTKRVTDQMAGTLDESEARAVAEHLERCAACRAEVEGLGGLWLRLGLLPDEEPSETLRHRFYAALDEFEREQAARPRPTLRQRLLERLEAWWAEPGSRRLAMAASSLALGIALGGMLFGGAGRTEVRQMQRQVDSLEQLVAVSLLRQDSASARLEGVSYGRQVAARDDRVVAALIEAASTDRSANVRMAAIDALRGLGSRPAVRDRLARSLRDEPSPMVQMAVVDLLVREGQGADPELQRLLGQVSLDDSVRAYLDNLESLPSY